MNAITAIGLVVAGFCTVALVIGLTSNQFPGDEWQKDRGFIVGVARAVFVALAFALIGLIAKHTGG